MAFLSVLLGAGVALGVATGRPGHLLVSVVMTVGVCALAAVVAFWGARTCHCGDTGGYFGVVGAVLLLGGYTAGFGAMRVLRLRRERESR